MQEVNDSLVSINMDKEKLQKQKDIQALEIKDFTLAEEKYKEGVIAKLDLDQQQENLLNVQKMVYNTEFDPNDIQIKLSDLINNTESYSRKSFIYKGFGNTIQDPLFIAPEFIEKKYNNKVDIWGVGMLAYLLFVGEPPFKGNRHQIIYKISNDKIEYPSSLNEMKKDLLKKMLYKNPNERYEADELLKEEYFHQDDQNEEEPISE